MIEDRAYRVARTVNEIDYAVGDLLDLGDQFHDPLGRTRVALGWLEDERVAASDRVGEEPERDHRREVEGRDCRAHADGLAHQLDIDAGRHTFEVLALEEVGDAARSLG